MRYSRKSTYLKQGAQLNRRAFVHGAASLSVAMGLMGSMGAFAETPKRGGHLKIGLNGGATSDSLDPALFVSDFMSAAGAQFYDQLTAVDEHLAVRPALAESWEPRSGAKQWVYKLRKGVAFHSGKTLTAADVVFSMNHHRGPTSKSGAKSVMKSILDIKATDKDEVTFFLDGPNADMPYLLAHWLLGIVPEDSTFTDGVGTGAFIIERFEPGVRMLTKRNPNDWRGDRGYVDSVESIVINNSSSRFVALQSGAVDIINKVPANGVTPLEENPQMQVFETGAGSHPVFAMFCDTPPYDNLDVRLALKYGVDREAILKTVLQGHGKIANDHPVPAHDPMYAPDIPQRIYDPDKAKFHMKKSGYDGEFLLYVSELPIQSAVEMATVFQASATRAGVPLRINRVPDDGYDDVIWLKKPFCVSSWGGRPVADLMLTTAYLSTATYNETHWRRPEFDDLLIKARGEIDVVARKKMYHDLQFMLHEEGGAIIPIFTNILDAGHKKVRGFVPSPFQQLSGYRAAEMVWLEE